jgi:hypothetical protein
MTRYKVTRVAWVTTEVEAESPQEAILKVQDDISSAFDMVNDDLWDNQGRQDRYDVVVDEDSSMTYAWSKDQNGKWKQELGTETEIDPD